MNHEQISGRLKQFKGRLLELYPKLDRHDLEEAVKYYLEGKKEILEGRLLEVYGVAKEELENLASKMESSYQEGISNVKKMSDTVVDYAKEKQSKISEYAHEGKRMIADYVEQGQRKLSEYAEQGQEKFEQTKETVKDQTHAMMNHASDYVEKCCREKPMTSLLVAAGIGAVIGALLSR